MLVRAREHVAAIRLAVALGVLSTPTALWAQRRDGETAAAVLTARLTVAAKFGTTVVTPRLYHVTLSPAGLVLTDPQSRVVVATLPVQEKAAATAVDPAQVEVSEQGSKVTIVLKHLDHVYTAAGEKTQAQADAGPQVTLAKSETAINDNAPVQQTETELVQQALARYGKDVVHCADKALHSGWGTDDEHFSKCVCPLASKWRLPKVKQPLRVPYVLVKGRAGLLLTAQADGHGTDCRVWVGTTIPDDEMKPAASPAGGDGKSAEPKTADAKPLDAKENKSAAVATGASTASGPRGATP